MMKKLLAVVAVLVVATGALLAGCSENTASMGTGAAPLSEAERVDAENAASGAAASDSVSSGVTPEFKKMMDEYEAFVDEYVAFMESYDADASSAESLERYSSYMAQYAETAAAIEAVDQESLSEADAVYYIEVTSRVSSKLLSVL